MSQVSLRLASFGSPTTEAFSAPTSTEPSQVCRSAQDPTLPSASSEVSDHLDLHNTSHLLPHKGSISHQNPDSSMDESMSPNLAPNSGGIHTVTDTGDAEIAPTHTEVMDPHHSSNNSPRTRGVDTARMVDILERGTPTTGADYAEHLYKVASLLLDGQLSETQAELLEKKLLALADMLPQFVEAEDPAASQLYLVVERCFDVLIRVATGSLKVLVSTLAIRFLTTVVMTLNYWELYNLLRWKPAIYQFLTLIRFDLNNCYARFVRDYLKYEFRPSDVPSAVLKAAAATKERDRIDMERRLSLSQSPELESADERSPLYAMNKELSEDHDRFVTEQMLSEDGERPIPRERRKMKVDAKLAAHRVIKRADIKVAPSSRSSNYDPDVVHECQMASPDEPDKLCLRRFSRKYELIRHQETVHSKKKKLFKCFVCIKQDPSIGPRIFTRHDTLAKHIRVNHRISGKEAKAEVAYSKKHAEIVEEGDITVHVGRRKTKVDFELRAHMEKKGLAREAPDGSIIFDDIDSPPDSLEDGDDDDMYDDAD